MCTWAKAALLCVAGRFRRRRNERLHGNFQQSATGDVWGGEWRSVFNWMRLWPHGSGKQWREVIGAAAALFLFSSAGETRHLFCFFEARREFCSCAGLWTFVRLYVALNTLPLWSHVVFQPTRLQHNLHLQSCLSTKLKIYLNQPPPPPLPWKKIGQSETEHA